MKILTLEETKEILNTHRIDYLECYINEDQGIILDDDDEFEATILSGLTQEELLNLIEEI